MVRSMTRMGLDLSLIHILEGMMFDRGYSTPYMVTDTEKMEAVIDDAYILITDKKISVISRCV